MRVTAIRVCVSKTVSDGQYGNEKFEAQYLADLEDGEDPDEAIRVLSERGRASVVKQLGESGSYDIRSAIEPPKDVEWQRCPADGTACVCERGPFGDICQISEDDDSPL